MDTEERIFFEQENNDELSVPTDGSNRVILLGAAGSLGSSSCSGTCVFGILKKSLGHLA